MSGSWDIIHGFQIGKDLWNDLLSLYPEGDDGADLLIEALQEGVPGWRDDGVINYEHSDADGGSIFFVGYNIVGGFVEGSDVTPASPQQVHRMGLGPTAWRLQAIEGLRAGMVCGVDHLRPVYAILFAAAQVAAWGTLIVETEE